MLRQNRDGWGNSYSR